MVAAGQFSPDRARIVIQNCFADLISDADAQGGYVPRTSEPDQECAEQAFLSSEAQRDLLQQIATSEFQGSVLEQAATSLDRRGVKLDTLTSPTQLTLLSGIARAMIEHQRWFQLRMTDRLAAFEPIDPLFNMPATAGAEQAAPPRPNLGMAIGQAVADYLRHGESIWVPKTSAARRWQLGFFVEHVGADHPLTLITADHVRSFRQAVCCLHKRHGKQKGMTFAAKQTPSKAHRISDKTASITFEPVKAFFRWAKAVEGLISSNPSEDIRMVAPKQPKGKKVRRPFTREELNKLFSAPIFRGCRSRHRRYEAGSEIIKDGKFWIPVLGFYTGARLGELVQLHVRDVCLTSDIPYLSINEENCSTVADGDRKHVKSQAGVRLVPLHPDIMELGFAKFVATRALGKGRGRVRLFHEFPYGSDGVASTVASKWFARFMDAVGLTDRTLVFHSFRHNAEDAFRDALTPQYVTDRIIGHSDASTSARYGDGASLAVLYEAVQGMKLKIRVVQV